jgi:hypothetical protein
VQGESSFFEHPFAVVNTPSFTTKPIIQQSPRFDKTLRPAKAPPFFMAGKKRPQPATVAHEPRFTRNDEKRAGLR